jgi:hypothetical protein
LESTIANNLFDFGVQTCTTRKENEYSNHKNLVWHRTASASQKTELIQWAWKSILKIENNETQLIVEAYQPASTASQHSTYAILFELGLHLHHNKRNKLSAENLIWKSNLKIEEKLSANHFNVAIPFPLQLTLSMILYGVLVFCFYSQPLLLQSSTTDTWSREFDC